MHRCGSHVFAGGPRRVRRARSDSSTVEVSCPRQPAVSGMAMPRSIGCEQPDTAPGPEGLEPPLLSWLPDRYMRGGPAHIRSAMPSRQGDAARTAASHR